MQKQLKNISIVFGAIFFSCCHKFPYFQPVNRDYFAVRINNTTCYHRPWTEFPLCLCKQEVEPRDRKKKNQFSTSWFWFTLPWWQRLWFSSMMLHALLCVHLSLVFVSCKQFVFVNTSTYRYSFSFCLDDIWRIVLNYWCIKNETTFTCEHNFVRSLVTISVNCKYS